MIRSARTLIALAFLAAAQTGRAGEYAKFIWTDAPFPSAHASTIAQAKDGALLSAWFGGTDEGNKDVGIWSSRREPGKEWNPPVQLFKEPGQPAWNPVLFTDAAGVVWLWFKAGPSPERWTGAYMQSKDDGKNWGPVTWLTAGLLGPVRCKPLTLANGDILAGTSMESYKAWGSWMEISSDGGKSWRRYGPISFPDPEMDRRGTIQPTLMEVKPGVIRAFFRTRGLGKVATSLSSDGGKTWELVRLTELDHPGAGIDAVRMADGRCAMVYNPSTKRRNPLSLAISHDDGETWKDAMEIDRLPEGDLSELSYPAIIQSADGALQITYTFRREKIKHAEIPLSALEK